MLLVTGDLGSAAAAGDSALARYLSRAAGAPVTIERAERMSGGAIQQNWLLDVRVGGGRAELVLRTDGQSSLEMSHTRAQEFAILKVAHAAGVTVAEPLWLCEDLSVIGTPFFIMKRVAGTAVAARVIRDEKLGGERSTLAERLGGELALIHGIRPPRVELPFLAVPQESPAHAMIAVNRATLDRFELHSRPVLEWGLRWLERNAPPARELVLCHHDFRSGNYLVDETGVTAILDWEFAGWGDPAEDLGWFCAACWRFGADQLEAGGIGSREAFYRGYERRAGTRVDPRAVHYWEVAAHVRWGIIALLQADRHISGAESSLELALTSHIVPELEFEILALTGDEF
jgi:aminoglycoside phosphotransferase (APT) family kinase protein